MKTYVVEFQQTTYTQIEVKARNENEAFNKAWKNVDKAEYIRDGDPDLNTLWEKDPSK